MEPAVLGRVIDGVVHGPTNQRKVFIYRLLEGNSIQMTDARLLGCLMLAMQPPYGGIPTLFFVNNVAKPDKSDMGSTRTGSFGIPLPYCHLQHP